MALVATVRQLDTPTGWPALNGGKDIFGAYMDKDGATAWVFQFINPGFARIDLATGHVIFSGTIFGDTSATHSEFLAYAGDNTQLWEQDASGHYYTFYSGAHGVNPFFETLYKLQVGASTSGDLGNGYMQTVATALTSTLFGVGPSPGDGIAAGRHVCWLSGGVNYMAFCCNRWLVVLNVDTMTQVGRFDTGSSSYAATGCFVDNNGDLWSIWHRSGISNFRIRKWVPASGASGGVLNGTTTDVSNATTGLGNNNQIVCTYVPSLHAVALFSNGLSDASVVELTTFTRVVYKAADTAFYYWDWYSGNTTQMQRGVQPSGAFSVEGALVPYPSIGTQRGGVFNLIDPATLTLTDSVDITAAILAATGVDLPPTDGSGVYGPWACAAYDEANSRMLVTYQRGAFTITASPAYLISFSAPVYVAPIGGYLLTRPCQVKTALQNLMAAHFIDVVESDFKLKFVPRGSETVAMAIPEDDLGLIGDKAKLSEQTAQEQELPKEVNVLFVDPNIDYQQNKVQKMRSSRAVSTMQSVTMTLPLVLDSTQARKIAEKALYLAYLEGKPFNLNLWKAVYMQLDPSDVVTFEYQGNTYQIRIADGAIGVNYTCQINGVSEDANTYLSYTGGGNGDGTPENPSAELADTLMFLLDLPYLSDTDAVGDRTLTGFYVGASSDKSSWGGAILYRSADDVAYDSIGSSAARMVYGTVTGSPLGAPPTLWAFDDVNTLEITMTFGTLAGVTDAELLNGANGLIVGGEVIQFGNAIETSPGVYTISHLLRGRRNTEYAAYGHGASERVLDPTTGIQRIVSPLSLIGLLRYYKGVSVGQDITTIASQTLTLAPADLKPASPVHFTGARDGSNNLTIGWTRRTRYAGDWLNNTGDVPLNEDSEAYEIDVMNGLTVVRTIAWTPGTYDADGNPTADYSAADQTTDFGSPQASVAIKIYQLSAQVGRGFPGTGTV